MSKGLKIFLWIAAIVIVAAIILAWNWEKWFGTSELSEYDKCLAANKAKPDGAACTNCISNDPALRQTMFQGTIKDGVCIEKQSNTNSAAKYMITNPNGAIVYVYTNGNFMGPDHPQLLPVNTEVKIIRISTDKKYAETEYGWVSVKDISGV